MEIKREFLLAPFEGPWYPGFLAGVEASVGKTSGTLGKLVAILEQHFGIPPVEGDQLVRLMTATGTLRKWLAGNPKAFFAESFTLDPEASASRLLQWRDALWMGGWSGNLSSLPPRLKTAMEAFGSPGGEVDDLGLPGRIRRVISVLHQRKEKLLDALFLLQEKDDIEPLTRDLLAALEESGTRIYPWEVKDAAAPKGDLGKVRAKASGKGKDAWDPKGDGSLLMLTAAIPGEAAEALASWMEEAGTEGMILIAGETARGDLDAALRLHHLAAVGSGGASPFGSALQVLPLSLALQWEPLDPAVLLEFLQLPLSPIPRWAGHKLARILAEKPGIENKDWLETYASCIAEAPARADGKDPKVADRMKERLECWLPSPRKLVQRNAAIPKGRLDELCKETALWARRRAAFLVDELEAGSSKDSTSAENQISLLKAAADQADQFQSILDLDGRKEFSQLEAARLLQTVSTDGPDLIAEAPEAGSIFAVHDPAAVLDRAKTIVWWDFTQNSAGRVQAPLFTAAEVKALGKAGIRLQDPARAALRMGSGWRRPLLAAAEKLILVTWESHLGEAQSPHPLWDQLTSGLEPAQRARLIQPVRPVHKLTSKRFPVRTGMLDPQDHPSLKRHWSLKNVHPGPRDEESASSITTLAGCPFKYLLEYQASARSASGVQLVDDTMLRGTLSHRVLQAIFTKRHPVPDEKTIRKEADEQLDRLVREEGASLLLPGKEASQAQFRLAVVRAAVALGRLLSREKLTVESSETELSGDASFGKLRGYADMLLKDAKGKTYVLDMKYSDYGDSRYVRALAESEPVQLAVYAKMVDLKAPVAYYSLGDAQLLTTEQNPFPGGRPIPGVSAKETWARVEKSVAAILKDQFKKGDVIATGISGTTEEDAGIPVVADGLESMEPPCVWCDYSAICGRLWGEQEEESEENEEA